MQIEAAKVIIVWCNSYLYINSAFFFMGAIPQPWKNSIWETKFQKSTDNKQTPESCLPAFAILLLGHVSIQITEGYACADSKQKRVALEKAYVEVNSNEKSMWLENENLITWLKRFCKRQKGKKESIRKKRLYSKSQKEKILNNYPLISLPEELLPANSGFTLGAVCCKHLYHLYLLAGTAPVLGTLDFLQ